MVKASMARIRITTSPTRSSDQVNTRDLFIACLGFQYRGTRLASCSPARCPSTGPRNRYREAEHEEGATARAAVRGLGDGDGRCTGLPAGREVRGERRPERGMGEVPGPAEEPRPDRPG